MHIVTSKYMILFSGLAKGAPNTDSLLPPSAAKEGPTLKSLR